jgi:uncharacterized coiled-coil DUF342 family protein
MPTDYLGIIQELTEFVIEFREKANDCRKNADSEEQEAEKWKERALLLPNKAQEYHKKHDECIQSKDDFINSANEQDKLADTWEKLAKDIQNKSSEVLTDIEKLENFLQQGCEQTNCPEIRLLIENRVLQECTRYQKLLDFCQDQ